MRIALLNTVTRVVMGRSRGGEGKGRFGQFNEVWPFEMVKVLDNSQDEHSTKETPSKIKYHGVRQKRTHQSSLHTVSENNMVA